MRGPIAGVAFLLALAAVAEAHAESYVRIEEMTVPLLSVEPPGAIRLGLQLVLQPGGERSQIPKGNDIERIIARALQARPAARYREGNAAVEVKRTVLAALQRENLPVREVLIRTLLVR